MSDKELKRTYSRQFNRVDCLDNLYSPPNTDKILDSIESKIKAKRENDLEP